MPKETEFTVAREKHSKSRLVVEHPAVLRPEDWARFVELPGFSGAWKKLKLNDEDRKALQVLIMMGPKEAPVIKGTGGLRKARFAPVRWKVGKSDAARVCYAYFADYSIVLLVAIYRKSRKDNLSQAERNEIKRLLDRFERQLESEKTGRKRNG